MAAVFYHGFAVVRIDASGQRSVSPGENVSINNITSPAFLGVVVADNDGNVPGTSVAATADDILEFTGSTGATFRQRAGATLADASKDPRNNVMSFVLEDFSTPATSDNVNVYFRDTATPTGTPLFAGPMKRGTTVKFPFPAVVAKSIDVVAVLKDVNNKLSQQDLSLAPFANVSIPASGGGGGSSSFNPNLRTLIADYIMPANTSLYFSGSFDTDTFVFESPSDAIWEIA